METDQNLTRSGATGDGVRRSKHNQRQVVDSNGPHHKRTRTDDRSNASSQRRKYSEKAPNAGLIISDVAPVEQSGTRDGCKKRGMMGDGKSCNGGGSPLGNDKCDSDTAEEMRSASMPRGRRNKHEETPKLETDDGCVKRETTDGEVDRECASPLKDHVKDTIKEEDGKKDVEIQGDNGSTADGGGKRDVKPADVEDDFTDVKGKSADDTSEKEDGLGQEDPLLLPHRGEDVPQDIDGLSGANDGGVNVSSDANLPLDMTMSSADRKQTPTSVSQRPGKSEGRVKSDSLRPVGRMLHDLGLDLVRQQVYKDLISIQLSKDSKNLLDEKEKEQLQRLTDAHSKLLVKNASYQLPFELCRCGYSSSSANVMALHEEFGSTYEVPFHACCVCDGFKTRWPSQFVSHVDTAHDRKGRVQARMATNVCRFCPYEHKNQSRMEVHVAKCFKKFNLNTNLQPLPADCDVPLLGKSSQPGNAHQARMGIFGGPLSYPGAAYPIQHASKQVVGASSTPASGQPSVMEIGGQLYSLVHHNGKALFTSLRSQMGSSGGSNAGAPPASTPPSGFPRFAQPSGRPVAKDQRREKCEMCDATVNDREALWLHFRTTHRVELSKVSMIEKEPWMMCDVCTAKFWTYQGLARHSVLLHKRELAPPATATPARSFKCFLCLQVQTNPLNHLSTYHNITLLDMYHSRRCCMCNRRFRAAPAFEEHMVLQHHDIFANKDVLCTVLQALSTALSLKRQETVQQRVAPASSTKVSPRSSNGQSPGPARVTSGPMSSPGQKNTPEAPSPSGKAHPDMRKRGHKRASTDRVESEAAGKATPKKSTEEDTKELNKLYKDYADIGRPILRSMRHRLSQGGTEKVQNTGSKSTTEVVGTDPSTSENDTVRAEQDLIARPESMEPCAKKPCLESLRNDLERNDAESADNHKQLREIRNADTTSLAEGQKAS